MKQSVLSLLLVIAASVTLGGCLHISSATSGSDPQAKKVIPKRNTNPQRGWVKVFTHPGKNEHSYDDIIVYKRCNGRNLVYMSTRRNSDYGSQSISVIPEDKQCTKPQ